MGYFLGLKKSTLTPRQVVPYLGFLVDSVRQAFLLIQEKKQKCLSLTRHVLSCSSKPFSVCLGSTGLRSSVPISVSGSLKDEIQHWLFLESWTGYLPWRQELHHQVKLCSDASSFAWACTLGPNAHNAMIRDYWPADQRGLHINVKETLALVNALEALSFRDSWVDVFTDSQVLIRSWQSQGAKSHALSNALKKLFWVVSKTNIHLNLCYIPSPLNPANPPSRVLSLQDAKLSPSAWSQVQVKFGGRLGHSADLMALPSNVQCSLDGSPFLSFLHTQLLVVLGSMFLLSFQLIMVTCFLTLTFSLPLYSFLKFCALLKASLFLALLLFLTCGLVNFGGLYFNHFPLSYWHLEEHRI